MCLNWIAGDNLFNGQQRRNVLNWELHLLVIHLPVLHADVHLSIRVLLEFSERID